MLRRASGSLREQKGKPLNEGPVISAVETVIDNGSFGTRTVKFETGLLARQAAGSVTAYLDDDTMLLSATTAGKHPKDHFDFFPLTIDVEERMYAAGRIPGSFFRREGRPSEDAILTCRLIDRPLRPTFKKGLRNEVQVVITVLALEPDTPYDVLAINAASASTQISGLPFTGPVGGTRVALIDGQWVAFPTHSQLEDAVFDMVVAGRVTDTGDVAIMMVEAESTEQTWDLVRSGSQAPTEEVVAGGLEAAKPFIKQLCEAQTELAKQAAKPVQEFPIFLDYEDDVYDAVNAAVRADVAEAMTIADKQEREARSDERLHLDSRLRRRLGRRLDLDRSLPDLERDLDVRQRQLVAEGNQLGGSLGRHDPGDLRRVQRVPFREIAQRAGRRWRHADGRDSHRASPRDGLRADVDHLHLAGLADVGELPHRRDRRPGRTLSPAVAASVRRGRPRPSSARRLGRP